MSLRLGSEEVLLAKGWCKLTDGPYLAAWHQFWGKDVEASVLQPWKTWNNGEHGQYSSLTSRIADKHTQALAKRPKAKTGSTDASIHDLARMILDDESDLTLPPCTYLGTPWIDELPDTKGRVMVAEGYNHVYGRIKDLHADSRSPGVIVEGQGGIGTRRPGRCGSPLTSSNRKVISVFVSASPPA